MGALLMLLSACSETATQPPPSSPTLAVQEPERRHIAAEAPDYEAIVAAEDRTEADRALDAGRQPAAMLEFMQVRQGMYVGEIAAGGGYTTELLVRATGIEGAVWGVNSPWLLDRFAEKPWSARLARPVMANNTLRLDREFDDPFPEGLNDLDLVVNVLFYHDTYWMELDRPAMNRAIFDTLKPGGHYVVIDHASRDVMSTDEVLTLHRIGEQQVRQEIESVGFVLEAQGEFLRNPQDNRDWNASPSKAGERRGTSDRFAFRFVKPVAKPGQ